MVLFCAATVASERASATVMATAPATPTLEAPTPEMACVEILWPTPSSSPPLPKRAPSSSMSAV